LLPDLCGQVTEACAWTGRKSLRNSEKVLKRFQNGR